VLTDDDLGGDQRSDLNYEALQVCHRAYVLQTGRIVMEGTGSELLRCDMVRKAYLGI